MSARSISTIFKKKLSESVRVCLGPFRSVRVRPGLSGSIRVHPVCPGYTGHYAVFLKCHWHSAYFFQCRRHTAYRDKNVDFSLFNTNSEASLIYTFFRILVQCVMCKKEGGRLVSKCKSHWSRKSQFASWNGESTKNKYHAIA